MQSNFWFFFIVSVEIWFALSNEFCETLIHFQFPSYTSAINLDETFLRISCLSKTADLNLDFACWTFLIIISIYFEGVTLKTGNSCFATTEIIFSKIKPAERLKLAGEYFNSKNHSHFRAVTPQNFTEILEIF